MKKIILPFFAVLSIFVLDEVKAQNLPVKSASTSVTLNYLPKFSSLSNGSGYDLINNSLIYDNGTNIGIGTTSPSSLLSLRTTKIASYSGSNWPTPTLTVENIANDPNTLSQYATIGFGVCSQTSGNNSMGAITLIQPTYLSRASNFAFSLRNSAGNTNEILRLQSDGNVGIALQTPGSKLQVNGNAAIGYSSSTSAPANGLLVNGNVGIGNTNPQGKLMIGNAPTNIVLSDLQNSGNLAYGVSYIGFNASRSSNTWNLASDGVHNGGGVIMTTINGEISFIPINNSSTPTTSQSINEANNGFYNNRVLTIYPGTISGTHLNDAYVRINGSILCKEVVVTLAGWPDFVFNASYPLMTIMERENYIKLNGHLPHIASAKTIEQNGANLGQTVSGLMQNTEEITLYLIDMYKRLELLEQENKLLKEKLEQFENN